MRELLVAAGVAKSYRAGSVEVAALRGVDLTLRAGEFVAVTGPSGSGKTTLLNCLSGLDSVDAGEVVVDGESIHRLSDDERTQRRARTMGFVFQTFDLIPVMTAVENVELPLLLSGMRAGAARRRAADTLDRVGLGARARHRPGQLSGGEQQRVSVARAVAGEPRIVWADEPTGSLDSESAESVMQLLLGLHERGLTLVVVTHDRGIAAAAPREIAMRDGAIVDPVVVT
ncbi:MAG: ABC transporter ATP-binding protein [Actinomycetota bacterium]